MKKLTQQELDKMLEQHEKWVMNSREGCQLKLIDMDCSSLDFSKRNLYASSFIDCFLSYANFDHANLNHALFQACDIAFASFLHISGHHLQFENVRGSETAWNDSDLCDCIMVDCLLPVSRFVGCVFKGSHFSEVSLLRSNFTGSSLNYTNWHNCCLKECDLTGVALSDITMLNTDLSQSRGLPSQADYIRMHFESDEKGFYAYKVFDVVYQAPESWIRRRGEEIKEVVNMDRFNRCSYGVNVATKHWIHQSFRADPGLYVWKVLIPWKYVADVCVPFMTEGTIRCGRCILIESMTLEDFNI